MAEIFDFKKYYQSKNSLKYFGLTKREAHVCVTCLSILCELNPKMNTEHFDPEQKTNVLLSNDRRKFETWFSAIVRTLDLYDVIGFEEIPAAREFEEFPMFLDVIEFFIEKDSLKNN